MLQSIILYEKRLITQHCSICPIGAHLVWKSPIYRFLIEGDLDENEEQTIKEVVIDVTNSAPRFEGPEDVLKNVLNQVLSFFPKRQKPLILDFGAGKLRNTLHLLKNGYNVRAVEFEKISNGTQQAKDMYEKAQTYGRQFDKLVFPHEFFNSKEQFDLVLLINVCPIMPVPAERLLVLKYCRDKLKDNGFVFWYSIHRDSHMRKQCTNDVKIGDGYYMNKTKRYQTFYRDLDYHEVDCMFLSNGFRVEKQITVPHNVAKIYKKVGNNPIIDNILNAEIIRQYIKIDEELEEKKSVGVQIYKQDESLIPNIPNPEKLKEEQIFIDALQQLKTGNSYATDYHNLIYAILLKLFIPPLKNPKIEKEINEGKKRIDIVMNNTANKGFFKDIIEKHNIHAGYIMIECKNYSGNIGNPELDQLSGRFSDTRGNFGILCHRNSKKDDGLIQSCIDYRKDHKNSCIIPLNDTSIIEILTLKLYNENIDDYLSDLDDYLNEKLQLLDF